MWQLLYSSTTYLLVFGDPARFVLVNEYGRHIWMPSKRGWYSPSNQQDLLSFELILGEHNDDYSPVDKLTALIVCGLSDANAEQIGSNAPVV